MSQAGEKTDVNTGVTVSPASQETSDTPQPDYINSNSRQLEEPGIPPPQSSEYIQLALANGPVTNGYIQIQQLPKNVVPDTNSPTPTTTKSELDSGRVALVGSSFQDPGYSQVGLIKPQPSNGYIQVPPNSVVISPGLLDQSGDPRALEHSHAIL